MKRPICTDCKWFSIVIKGYADCKNPKAPRSGDELAGNSLPSARLTRESFFRCGKRGRWFEPKEKSE